MSSSGFSLLSWRTLLIFLVVGGAIFFAWRHFAPSDKAPPPTIPPQPVRIAMAKQQNVPEYLNGLGTVTAANTALVRSRVDGQLQRLHFTEGQMVKAGDLLAEIDPRPFEVSLSEARGLLARDQAILENARQDLARYTRLGKTGGMSAQEVDTQRSLVRQYEGIVKNDQAQVDAAELQLTYSRITAPISGRLGLREVDEGNMIRASDADGIVRITQTQPVYVVFTLPETRVPLITEALRQQASASLPVQAWDREQKHLLATGTLLTLDNQIDLATGTVKLKARFENTDDTLFPNQFVNARLLVRTLKDVVTVPASAVQLGPNGYFVYVIKNGAVSVRQVDVGWKTDTLAVIDKGVAAGEEVVTDGLDSLRDGTRVVPVSSQSPSATPAGTPL